MAIQGEHTEYYTQYRIEVKMLYDLEPQRVRRLRSEGYENLKMPGDLVLTASCRQVESQTLQCHQATSGPEARTSVIRRQSMTASALPLVSSRSRVSTMKEARSLLERVGTMVLA